MERYDGKVQLNYPISNFYGTNKNHYVFGNINEQAKLQLLHYELTNLKNQRIPTVFLYQCQRHSSKYQSIQSTLRSIPNIIMIDEEHPNYEPFLNIPIHQLIEIIDEKKELTSQQRLLLETSFRYVAYYENKVQLDYLLQLFNKSLHNLQKTIERSLNDNPNFENMYQAFCGEDTKVTDIEAIYNLLLRYSFKMTKGNGQISCQKAVLNKQVICIHINQNKQLDYILQELETITDEFRFILMDVNLNNFQERVNQIVNYPLSLYYDSFLKGFKQDHMQMILSEPNITMCFQMQAGIAEILSAFYGKFDFIYVTKNKSVGREKFILNPFAGYKNKGENEVIERTYRLQPESISAVKQNECYIIEGDDIVNVKNLVL